MVALGGNALVKQGEEISIPNQLKHITEAMRHIIPLLKEYNIVITHAMGYKWVLSLFGLKKHWEKHIVFL